MNIKIQMISFTSTVIFKIKPKPWIVIIFFFLWDVFKYILDLLFFNKWNIYKLKNQHLYLSIFLLCILKYLYNLIDIYFNTKILAIFEANNNS